MLPIKAIDRIFERLVLTYGHDFQRHMEGQSMNDVKSLWAHELGSFAPRLQDIAWALEHLPERAPNVIQFRNLCRQAPAEDMPALPAPKADPARVQAELAKLAPMKEAMRSRMDSRDWARRLIARHETGEHRSTPTALAMARQALGMTDGR